MMKKKNKTQLFYYKFKQKLSRSKWLQYWKWMEQCVKIILARTKQRKKTIRFIFCTDLFNSNSFSFLQENVFFLSFLISVVVHFWIGTEHVQQWMRTKRAFQPYLLFNTGSSIYPPRTQNLYWSKKKQNKKKQEQTQWTSHNLHRFFII